MRRIRTFGMACMGAGLVAGTVIVAAAGPTPEQKCEGGKNDAAGKYAACVSKAERSYVQTGDAVKYGDSLGKCQDKLVSSWSKLEQKAVDAGTTCPSTGDQSPIQGFVDACAQSVADAVSGGTLLVDVVTCNNGLTTCEADLSATNADLTACSGDLASCTSDLAQCLPQRGLPATNQTLCWTGAGTLAPCEDTGHDGELQRGIPRSFTDNGDGTVTDHATGLMWEKLSDDGGIHDKDASYDWADGIAVKVGSLNSMSFAGYDDWRMPNVYELQTLINFGSTTIPLAFTEFHSGCIAGCTIATCSCTGTTQNFWTSTTNGSNTNAAFRVSFNDGQTVEIDKTSNMRGVRAVRGGY